MKKCPTCEKTFEDSMRFCQTDGTPLVEEAESAPPIDPYATIVSPSGLPLETAPEDDPFASAPEEIPAPEGSGDLLQIPEADPLKTMFVSEEEIRKEMLTEEPKEDPIFDVPSDPVPEPPVFNEPSLSPPSFGDMAPPASPFSASSDPEPEPGAGEDATLISPAPAPIPSPFSVPEPPDEIGARLDTSPFKEPEPTSSPFDQPSFSPAAESSEPHQMEWAPPPAPNASWENQPVGQDTPFKPPVVEGPSQGLAVGALVCGVLSILCCFISVFMGPAAIIMGFIAKKNATENPNEFGGASLALAGMICGGIGTVLGIVIIILQVFFGILGNIL
jgi:hypothetical protein